MADTSKNLWKVFGALEQQFPECKAVKLTIELQRWFVHQKQRAIADSMQAMLADIDQHCFKSASIPTIVSGADFEFKRDIAKFH